MRHVVWLKYNSAQAQVHQEPTGVWQTNGDGPMGLKTAQRIAREIREHWPGIQTKVLPENQTPE